MTNSTQHQWRLWLFWKHFSELPMPVTSDLVFQAYTVRLMKVTSVFQKSWSEGFWNDDFEVQNHQWYWGRWIKARLLHHHWAPEQLYIQYLWRKVPCVFSWSFVHHLLGYFQNVSTGNLYGRPLSISGLGFHQCESAAKWGPQNGSPNTLDKPLKILPDPVNDYYLRSITSFQYPRRFKKQSTRVSKIPSGTSDACSQHNGWCLIHFWKTLEANGNPFQDWI